MRIGSLFSGIGGLELGLERAGVGEVVWQVEQDPFCRKVLARHWPEARRYDDVREVGAHNLAPVDVICGGFPCQDVSVAGKGAGLEGGRSGLWSEFARIVRELRPGYAVVENVTALRSRGLGAVLGELSESGYDAVWDCVPAQAIGAPHRRDRLFVVAYPKREGVEGSAPVPFPNGSPFAGPSCDGKAGGFVGFPPRPGEVDRWRALPVDAQPGVRRGVDGLPHRMDRLRACGNAVVPQVAEVIGRFIVEHR